MKPINITLSESITFSILMVPQAKNRKTKRWGMEVWNNVWGLGQWNRVGVEVGISKYKGGGGGGGGSWNFLMT